MAQEQEDMVIDTPRSLFATKERNTDNFEVFNDSIRIRNLPIVLFTDDVSEQQVWYNGNVDSGRVSKPAGPPDVCAVDPIVMSPAYLGFAIEPYERRYLHYRGVGIIFARPRGGRFMQPSIDTILVCLGLARLFEDGGLQVQRTIDVGCGSGFLGKFVAAHAPGEGALSVSLVDIDPSAQQYCESPGFGALAAGRGGRPLSWSCAIGDAAELLAEDSNYDLVVANPPYIPTEAEVNGGEALNVKTGFWEGTGLVVFLVKLLAAGRCRKGAHLVLAMSSLTLKSPQVCAALEEASETGWRVRVLVEREIGWKAWYAGSGDADYLIAVDEERTTRRRLAGCGLFVGATEARRFETTGRKRIAGYHWHVAYVLDISHVD